MFPNLDIADHIPESIQRDIKATIQTLIEKGGKVRMIALPHDELSQIFNKLIDKFPFPFCPTLFGFPVEFGGALSIEVHAVRDDNTITTSLRDKEQIIWQQP